MNAITATAANSDRPAARGFDVAEAQRRLRFHAFALLLAAFAAALAIPFYPVPRTGLAAHVIGITGALLLIGTATVVPQLALPRRWTGVALVLLVAGVHLGFLGQWIGAFGGLSRMFVVTAAGRPEGHAVAETIVEVITKGITPTTFIACAVILWGLRRGPTAARA